MADNDGNYYTDGNTDSASTDISVTNTRSSTGISVDVSVDDNTGHHYPLSYVLLCQKDIQ